MNEQDPIKVYDAWNTQQAHFIRQLLADAGISARVASSGLQAVIGEVPFQLATCPVLVAKVDFAQARPIVEEYDRGLKNPSPKEPQPTEPFCYHCGAKVDDGQSPCPKCHCDLDWSD